MKGGRNVGKEKGREEGGKRGEGGTQEGKKARRKGGKEGRRTMRWKEIRNEGMKECRKKFGQEVESAESALPDLPFKASVPRTRRHHHKGLHHL